MANSIRKPKAILRRLLTGLLTLMALGVTIGVVVAMIFLSRQRATYRADIAEGKQLPQALSAARAAGLPTTLADLQSPMPPLSQNAAPVYERLSQILVSHPLTVDQQILEQFKSRFDPSDTDWPQAEKALHERSDLYTLIHVAAARPQCVFLRNWANAEPDNVQFPELETMHEALRLLTAQSLVMAHQGKLAQAVQNEELGFTIAHQGASDRTLVSYLFETSGQAITLSGLKQIVLINHGSESSAVAVQSAIKKNWHLPSISAALKGELATSLAEIDYIKTHGPNRSSKDDLDSTITSLKDMSQSQREGYESIMDANSIYLLHQMQAAILVADEPYATSQPILKRIDDASSKNGTLRLTHLFTTIMFPITAGPAQRRAQIQALVNVDLAGCAVFESTDKTGHLPDHLPGTFTDPFTDKPLKYRRDGKSGFVIYSVGQDGNFDGGKPGVRPDSYQIYFRYPTIPEK